MDKLPPDVWRGFVMSMLDRAETMSLKCDDDPFAENNLRWYVSLESVASHFEADMSTLYCQLAMTPTLLVLGVKGLATRTVVCTRTGRAAPFLPDLHNPRARLKAVNKNFAVVRSGHDAIWLALIQHSPLRVVGVPLHDLFEIGHKSPEMYDTDGCHVLVVGRNREGTAQSFLFSPERPDGVNLASAVAESLSKFRLSSSWTDSRAVQMAVHPTDGRAILIVEHRTAIVYDTACRPQAVYRATWPCRFSFQQDEAFRVTCGELKVSSGTDVVGYLGVTDPTPTFFENPRYNRYLKAERFTFDSGAKFMVTKIGWFVPPAKNVRAVGMSSMLAHALSITVVPENWLESCRWVREIFLLLSKHLDETGRDTEDVCDCHQFLDALADKCTPVLAACLPALLRVNVNLLQVLTAVAVNHLLYPLFILKLETEDEYNEILKRRGSRGTVSLPVANLLAYSSVIFPDDSSDEFSSSE